MLSKSERDEIIREELIRVARVSRILGKTDGWVLQVTVPEAANIEGSLIPNLQIRVHGNWTDRRSPEQLAVREKFGIASRMWNDLSDAEKAVWRRVSYAAGWPYPNNAFVSAVLSADG